MARFDVYRLGATLVLDVQTNLLSGLNTRLVAPLIPQRNAPISAGRLNPVFEIDGQLYSLQPQLIAAARRDAPQGPVDNLLRHHDRIVAALDMIFLGF